MTATQERAAHLATCPDCGNEYGCAHSLTDHRAEIHGLYSPAMYMRLTTSAGHLLRVILAADGTVLAATDEDEDTLPLWVTALTAVPEVEVTVTEWRQWKRNAQALS